MSMMLEGIPVAGVRISGADSQVSFGSLSSIDSMCFSQTSAVLSQLYFCLAVFAICRPFGLRASLFFINVFSSSTK